FEPDTFRFDAQLLDVLGVGALLAPHGAPAPGGDFQLVSAGADADVYERPWAPPARIASGRVAPFAADGTRWRIRVDSDRAGTLALGGARLPLLGVGRVDGGAARAGEDPAWSGLLALEVPAGAHEIVVAPRLPRALAGASAAGALGLLALVVA